MSWEIDLNTLQTDWSSKDENGPHAQRDFQEVVLTPLSGGWWRIRVLSPARPAPLPSWEQGR